MMDFGGVVILCLINRSVVAFVVAIRVTDPGIIKIMDSFCGFLDIVGSV